MSILLWRVYVENWGYGYCMSLGIMGFEGRPEKNLPMVRWRLYFFFVDNIIIGNLYRIF